MITKHYNQAITYKLLLCVVLGFSTALSVQAHSMNELDQAYQNKGKNYQPRTQHLNQQGRAKFINHLIIEDSPYLLQHAHNPIDWYAWSDEAFTKAKAENKPIFLSIGYATCHWCHVMEEESFDDIEIAKIMNEYFIAIKLDREIRPDIDAVYMNVAQLLNGHGGWPLNVVLLPDGRAFFAGTYFPKAQLSTLLEQIHNLWINDNPKLVSQANAIEDALNKPKNTTNSVVNSNISNQAVENLLNSFDELEGGFSPAPKFPNESMLLLLLDSQKRNPNDQKLNAITTTLDMMSMGGFYDVVGGGFHRYSTDNAWLIPHFEKMLYNQAQLALVYTRAFKLTNKPLYKRIAKQTLNYVLTQMQASQGGFFSATDADSEGEEGTFFIWSPNELQNVLNETQFTQMQNWFDLSSHSEFEGKHVIRFDDINNIDPTEYGAIDEILSILNQARSKRVAPLTDYKIILSWNALLISALMEAGEVLDNKEYTQTAITTAEYLYHHLYKDQQLYRILIAGRASTNALFEDYSYFANAFISLFDFTANQVWLERAMNLTQIMHEKFWDNQQFGFYISDNKRLSTRIKEGYDGAIPSANGIAYNVLVKLSNRIENNKQFKKQQEQLLSSFATQINNAPEHHSSFILGINNQRSGEHGLVQYAYDGRVKLQTQITTPHQVLLTISLAPLWHINSNQPIQKSLIATRVTNLDQNNWRVKQINYPKGELAKLGFSKEVISIYKKQAVITIDLEKLTDKNAAIQLQLALQACSDKVCLPPTQIRLMP